MCVCVLNVCVLSVLSVCVLSVCVCVCVCVGARDGLLGISEAPGRFTARAHQNVDVVIVASCADSLRHKLGIHETASLYRNRDNLI